MREKILEEIRRLAAANGGRVPGSMVFEREAGIRRHEWYGVYWARWGDAVIEAGFSPNDKQAKLDRDFVLKKVAEAYRHYKRVATNGELRMYRRVDSEFPAHSTLDNHFPTKVELVEALSAVPKSY